MDDDKLHDSLAGIKPLADSGHVTIIDEDGIAVHRNEDVTILYSAPPVLEGYRQANEPRMWRLPFRQKGAAGKRAGYSYAANTLAAEDLEKKIRALTSEGGEERANNVYDLPSIEQAIHWMHAALGYPAASTWLKAC